MIRSNLPHDQSDTQIKLVIKQSFIFLLGEGVKIANLYSAKGVNPPIVTSVVHTQM